MESDYLKLSNKTLDIFYAHFNEDVTHTLFIKQMKTKILVHENWKNFLHAWHNYGLDFKKDSFSLTNGIILLM